MRKVLLHARAESDRALFVKRRAIYYKLSPGTVEIVRVLHEQMDPDRHLEAGERA